MKTMKGQNATAIRKPMPILNTATLSSILMGQYRGGASVLSVHPCSLQGIFRIWISTQCLKFRGVHRAWDNWALKEPGSLSGHFVAPRSEGYTFRLKASGSGHGVMPIVALGQTRASPYVLWAVWPSPDGIILKATGDCCSRCMLLPRTQRSRLP